MAKNRIKELKQQQKDAILEEINYAHKTQLFELEETHISEFNHFNSEWDKRMNEFQVHSGELVNSLEEKHMQEREEHRDKMEQKIKESFKPSSELLNLQKIQVNLAKQKEYVEAHQVQVRAKKLETQEQNKYYQERENKIHAEEKKLVKKQELEMESLRKRIIAGENEQKKQRALDLEKMFQRYQNVKKELEKDHKREMNEFNKGAFNSTFNQNASKMSYRSNVGGGGVKQELNASARAIRQSAKKKRPSNVVRQGF